jgi:hypothetical protein
MLHSQTAVPADRSTPKDEVRMPKAVKIARDASPDVGEILVKRDGQPDLLVKSGRRILTVETQPVGPAGSQRWKVFKLYETVHYLPMLMNRGETRAIVAEEGHSEKKGETTRYNAYVCKNGVGIWESMDKMDELKPVLSELGWSVVEEL